jgi:hypothetical protein
LEQALPKIKAAGLGIAAISYDSVPVLKEFSARAGIHYPLLSDPDSATIRRFGILNETIDKGTPFYGIPHPGTYLVNAKGVITSKYFEEDYRVRDTAASVLLRQFGITPAEHGVAEGKHLSLQTSVSDAEARPGQRLTLALDITPGKRIHVYAPEIRGYIPISLALTGSKAFKSDPVVYPPAKTMNLRAIKETVPVYDRPFRVLQTVTLADLNTLGNMVDADRNLTIQGEFRYQACDDKECFLPETVPVTWKVHVMPFDRQRVPEPLRRKN